MAQQQLESQTASTLAVVEAFNEVFNRHDVDAIMNAMTDDCVFEGTGPVPDGARFQGQVAVRAVWERLFSSSPRALNIYLGGWRWGSRTPERRGCVTS